MASEELTHGRKFLRSAGRLGCLLGCLAAGEGIFSNHGMAEEVQQAGKAKQSEQSEQKGDYSEWWEKSLKGVKGERFFLNIFPEEEGKLEPEEINYFDDFFMNSTREVYSELPKDISSLDVNKKFRQRMMFVSFPDKPELVREYSIRSARAINDFFNWIGLKETINLPKAMFQRAEHGMNFQDIPRGVMPFMIVSDIKRFVAAQYSAEDLENNKVIEWKRSADRHLYGGVINMRTINETTREGCPVLKNILVSPIFVSCGENATEGYGSPPAEAFHWILGKTREDMFRQYQRKIWAEMGKPNSSDTARKINLEVQRRALLGEEGIVHGILNGYLEERQNQIGLTDDSLKACLHGEGSRLGKYQAVPRVREILRGESAVHLIREYMRNPVEVTESLLNN